MEKYKYFSKLIEKNKLPKVKTAIILSSGMYKLQENFDEKIIVDFSQIKYFPELSVEGHMAKLIFVKNQKGGYTLLVTGRPHFYENISHNEIFSLYLFIKCLGISEVITTNSVGAINKEYAVGDLVLVTDHINLSPNPLKNIEYTENKFVSMTDCYDKNIRKNLEKIAASLKYNMHKGVYIQFSGPSYETVSEINMARAMGADVVGMSCASECTILRYLDLKVASISMISNMASGLNTKALSHKEVLENVQKNSEILSQILLKYINL